jgi:hypothetical protein
MSSYPRYPHIHQLIMAFMDIADPLLFNDMDISLRTLKLENPRHMDLSLGRIDQWSLPME